MIIQQIIDKENRPHLTKLKRCGFLFNDKYKNTFYGKIMSDILKNPNFFDEVDNDDSLVLEP